MEKALIFSPPQRKPVKKQTVIEEPLDIVVLAPFTKTPRLMLQDVMIGCTSTTSLIIKNPTSCEVQVWVNPPKMELVLSWETIIIKASSEEVLSISWTPEKAFSGCSVIKIQADNGMKKDISIILKSIQPIVKKKANNTLKGGVKKPLVCAQQSSKFRKVIQATQKTIRTEITTALSKTIPTISYCKIQNPVKTGEKFYQQKDLNNKENITNNIDHSRHLNFCEILDSSEFSLSRMSPVSRINISSTPNTENYKFNDKFNKSANELTPLLNRSLPLNSLNVSGISLSNSKNKKQVSAIHDSSLESKINSLCFTPIHSSSMIRKKPFEEKKVDNTYTVQYNNGFVKDLQSSRMSSPINLSSDSISKETTDGAPKNSTYQLNISSGTYKICTSPEIHDDIAAIDDYLVNRKRRLLENAKKNVTQKSAKVKITYTEASSHNIIRDVDFPNDKTVDPFIFSTMFYDEQYFEQQELHILKWLNALLQPPSDLQCQVEGKVNLGKIWNDVKNKPLMLPQTKETVSHKLHVSHRLQSLRAAAKKLLKQPDLIIILTKCTNLVENEVLSIRADKQLHLDVSLQKYVMELFFCYNPLWLRIGLETVFNEPINISSNSDIHGLSIFIYNRLFKGQNVNGKQSNIFKQEFIHKLKKFVLKKFLMFVLFLDNAKKVKLIAHDPCLFAKTAPFKESREILINFAKELVAGIGDITRPLKTIGYIVTHKQSYVDEFDFAVKNLAVDIRDGIRLAKIMEIILLRKDLVCNLRAPPISRLQKIFNVSISFKALEEIGFVLFGGITPRDITDGYKEKTLSLFWQLIYKFQAPLFVKASTAIQIWWRSERIIIKRRELQHKRLLKEISATFIQSAWRGYKARVQCKILRFKVHRATRIIKNAWSAYREKQANELYQQNKAALKIQKAYKSYRFLKCLRAYIKTYTHSIILIQRHVKSVLLTRQLQNNYLKLRNAAVFVQRHYRSKLAMRVEFEKFETLKKYSIFVQRHYRNKICTRQIRNNYLTLKKAAVLIQQRYRAQKAMLYEQEKYQLLRKSTIVIQKRYRANKLMKETQAAYIKLKLATILIQQKFRAKLAMVTERNYFVKLQLTVILVQRKYRAQKMMQSMRNQFIAIKRSTLVIQKYYRARRSMRTARLNYLNLRKTVILCQRTFRAKLDMRKALNNYHSIRTSIITIQRRYRAFKLMQKVRNEYLSLRDTVIFIQNRYRAQKAMNAIKTNYLNTRSAAVVLQTRYRAQVAMKKDYIYYTQLKISTIFIQRKFRANREMQVQKHEYLQLKQTVILLQNKFRAKLAMRKDRNTFNKLKYYTIIIQKKFRTKCVIRKAMAEFKLLRASAIVIQNRFRAQRAMLSDRNKYQLLLKSAIIIQRRYRAKKLMEQCIINYNKEKDSIIYIQRKWKATLLMRETKLKYISWRKSALIIQRQYRAQKLMKSAREEYILLKESVMKIQTMYRTHLAMKKCFIQYNLLKKYTIYIQQKFRANQISKKVKYEYDLQRKVAINIQRRYRASKATIVARHNYLELKKKVIFIQRLWRAKLAMRKELYKYKTLRRTVLRMQRIFRMTHVLIHEHDPKLRRVISISTVIKIQAWWRAVQVRRKMPTKLKTIRNRLHKACKDPDPISIETKFNWAIEMILCQTKCEETAVYDALVSASRICPNLFEASARFLTISLYISIISNNRSVPELIIAGKCSEILVNLSKHPNTLQSILSADQIPELLTSASRFCDKEILLFCNICTVLWTFGQHEKFKLIVKRVLNKNDCKKTLQLIAKKVTRLDIMQNNLRKNIKSKVKMIEPLLVPDYGLPRKHPRTFANPKFATQCLIRTFSIPIEI